jgi:opacity protein-like surface antigen
MKRFARVVPILLALTLCASAVATAQPAARGATKSYAEFDVAATLGHKSDVSIGGEYGFHLSPDFDVFVEGGHIGNAATSQMDDDAARIAANVGATANTISKITFVDAGLRYHWPASVNVDPYVALGAGLAHVKNETTLSANSDLVQFGTDLNGTENRPIIMLGGGATVGFAKRYFVDLSYRFGAVLATGDASSVNKTQRAQVGIGIKF